MAPDALFEEGTFDTTNIVWFSEVGNGACGVADKKSRGDAAKIRRRPFGVVGFVNIAKDFALITDIFGNGDEDAAGFAEERFEELCAVGFFKMLQHVDEECEIVSGFE
ncbi:MAG: hypothetical protein RL141_26 [Candidatus Parcubacteria bacterium]